MPRDGELRQADREARRGLRGGLRLRRRGAGGDLKALVLALAFATLACAGGGPSPSRAVSDEETYLRWVTFEAPGHERVLLRWPKDRMPLRVHLPPPPPGLFEDPQAIYDSVRDGVLDWAAFQPRFGVARILVTARWSGGRVADLHDVHRVLLHEMGHALGLGGHSPRPGDIMYPSISQAGRGLSERDRATLAALYGLPIGRRVTGAKHER